MHEWRLLIQERIGPPLEHAAPAIHGEMPTPGIQDDLNIFPLQALADLESLAEQMDIAVGRDLSDEGDPPGGNGQWLGRDEIASGQFLEFAAAAILGWRQTAQAPLDMLGVDRVLQALQFALEGTQLGI